MENIPFSLYFQPTKKILLFLFHRWTFISRKMMENWRVNTIKLHIFSLISFVLIIFVILSIDSSISSLSLQLDASRSENNGVVMVLQPPHRIRRSLESKLGREHLQSHRIQQPQESKLAREHLQSQERVLVVEDSKNHEALQSHRIQRPPEPEPFSDVQDDTTVAGVGESTAQGYLVPAPDFPTEKRVEWFKNKLPEFEIFRSTRLSRRFDSRIRKFLDKQCKIQFFNTWISPSENFGRREFLAMESVFQAHPDGCLIILSRSLDSPRGRNIIKPLTDQGYRILTVTPDLPFLFSDTPAEAWFDLIKAGNKDPGRVPLAQNLSNLIRLAVLYKYGGVYLDTDFIVLRDFSGLKNSIGAQSVDIYGNWTILNNAVLVFDKNHPLLYKFIEEFATTFDGNVWGHNGPYLVSRVVRRVEELNYTVLKPIAFYPVDWVKIAGFFTRPNSTVESRWVAAKLIQLRTESYGVHLWNRESRRLKIEEGSILGRLISDHCVICKDLYSSRR